MTTSAGVVVECAIAVEPGPDPDCLGRRRQVVVFYREAGWSVAVMLADNVDELGGLMATGVACGVQQRLFHMEHPFETDHSWARGAWS